jgi:hypothetical protein
VILPILSVPYFIQPDSTSCQATVLKMMAAYLDQKRGWPVVNRVISEIKHSIINNDPGRPVIAQQNAWVNFQWWLQREFGNIQILMDTTNDDVQATAIIRRSISIRFPVLVSTNQNMLSSGHIILVVVVMRNENGRLVEPIPGNVGQEFIFICHDPYGRFGLQYNMSDSRWGQNRYDIPGGYSSTDGERGPGMFVPYTLEGIRRNSGTFLLIMGSYSFRSKYITCSNNCMHMIASAALQQPLMYMLRRTCIQN